LMQMVWHPPGLTSTPGNLRELSCSICMDASTFKAQAQFVLTKWQRERFENVVP